MGDDLYSDEYGTWRAVPGLSKSKIIVSSLGYTRLQNRKNMPLGQPTLNSQDKHGYRSIAVNRKHYRVCRLVLLAFCGQPPQNHTADHIAKYDGDFMKERGDDRIQNLRWASKSTQRQNVGKPKRRREDNVSIIATPVDGGDSVTFDGYNQAAAALGLNPGNISNVVNGKVGMSTGGWMFIINRVEEVIDGELWKEVTPTIQISSLGRVKRRRNSVVPWKSPYKVLPNNDRPYARVKVGTREETLHNMVWTAFGTRVLEQGETVDHIDQDTSNNSISNLRPATKSQQSLNQSRCSDGTNRMSLKNPVEGRPPNGVWQRWNSQTQAASELNSLLKPTGPKFSGPNIGHAVKFGIKHMGWEWRRV